MSIFSYIRNYIAVAILMASLLGALFSISSDLYASFSKPLLKHPLQQVVSSEITDEWQHMCLYNYKTQQFVTIDNTPCFK